MSAFEFVLILVSVVAGFAVSEILSGWGRLIRERVPIAEVGVHLLASFFLLLMTTRCVWILWIFRETEWRYLDFVLAFAPILVLALAAFVTNPVRAVRFEPAAHYMNHARPFCYLVALFFLAWNFGTLRTFLLEEGFVIPQLIGLVSAAIFVGLAQARSQVIHGIGLGAALLTVIFMSTVAVTNLGET